MSTDTFASTRDLLARMGTAALRDHAPARSLLLGLALAFTTCQAGMAQEPDWRLIRPSNTGIPGQQLQFAEVDQNDHLWVAGRFPFWSEGGIADFDGTTWTTYANIDSPIPDQWVNDVAFGPGDVNWYATSGGLVRHAGDDWQVFDEENSPLPTSQVFDVDVDMNSGTVWMRYDKTPFQTKGMASFDGTTWELHTPADMGLNDLAGMFGPAIDKNGDVWVSSNAFNQPDSGVSRFDGANWQVFNGSTGQSNAVASHITTDDAGDVWVRWWQGIMRWDGSDWIDVPDPQIQDTWLAFRVVGPSDIWVGTVNGLLSHYDGNSWNLVLEDGLPISSWILSIDFEADGDLWIATLNSGAKHRDAITGEWTTYSHLNTGLPSYFIEDFAEDTNGDMWIANVGAGVAKMEGTADDFKAATWRCFNADNEGFEPWPWNFGEPWGNDSALGVVADDAGGVWVASSGVGHWDGSSWDLKVPANSGISSQFGSDHVSLDAVGNLWVGFDLWGVDRFDGTAWDHWSTSNGLPGNFIDDLGAAPTGEHYAATNGGLGEFSNGAWTNITWPASLPFSATAVAVGPSGELWVGTAGGLARRMGGTWDVFTPDNTALPAHWVNDIVVDDDGTLYVATFESQVFPYPGGVTRFDGTTWTTWSKDDSPLPHNQITDLALDNEGNLWIAAASEAVAVMLFSDPWTDVGGSLAGAGGAPLLSGAGELTAGSTATLTASNAAPLANATLVAGLSQLSAPFKGGVLVPRPDVLISGLTTTSSGGLVFSGFWPAGVPSAAEFFFQLWIVDAGAPAGLAASNGVKAVTP